MTDDHRAVVAIDEPAIARDQTASSQDTLLITSVFTLHDLLRRDELVEGEIAVAHSTR